MRQPSAAKKMPGLPRAILLRISIAAYLAFVGFGAAAEGCDDDAEVVRFSIPRTANCAVSLPILSGGHGTPQTDGLDQQHPPQVRVEPRRWGLVVLGGGNKASRCGGMPNRRSAWRAPRLALPPLSLQELYCTWVI
jgi:hypothetical protein